MTSSFLDRREALALLAAAVTGPALAQGAWPTKPVTIVVPFAPGGTTDILARAIAPELSKALGQQFVVDHMPQIPNYGHWRRTGGDTSERGEYSQVPVFRAIRDKHGRIMVAMTHNTDIADAWEREGENPDYFYRFSPTGYAFGINVLLHALTH